MAQVTSKDVMALRRKTGLGVMDCKKALVETGGDFEKAVEYLRKKGIAKGAARSSRTVGEGMIDAYIHPGNKVGVLIEVLCETDFVAKSDDFRQLVHDLAMQVAAAAPLAVDRESLAPETVEKEQDIYREQVAREGKPPEIAGKIVAGKLEKYFQDNCLLEQPFVKDSKVRVGDLVLEVAGRLKENIQVRRFVRYALGG